MKPKRESMKVTVNLSVDLLQRVEAYADRLNINRSSAISALVSNALEYQEALKMVSILPKFAGANFDLKGDNAASEND